MLDDIDIKILNALLVNSREHTTTISRDLEISNVATQQRITKLMENGMIERFSARLNYHKLGFKTLSYIGIFLDKAEYYRSVITALADVPEVVEAHFTTGTYSIFVKVYAKDNQHLMRVLNSQIQTIEGIARTETFISLDKGLEQEKLLQQVPI